MVRALAEIFRAIGRFANAHRPGRLNWWIDGPQSYLSQLFVSAVMLIGITLVGTDLLLTRYTAEREHSLTGRQMTQSLRLIAPMLDSVAPQNLQSWADGMDKKLAARVTLIDGAGVVLADSRHDPETMENQRERPEVRAALEGHEGSSIRHSATQGTGKRRLLRDRRRRSR